jgi:glycine/D-amino acid oxidase-like deaminating enzyme
MAQQPHVAILGAGLAGAGTALELARRGLAVTLIDQDEQPFNRASLRNEGKIHLGLIYAKDRTLRTASLQLQGALRFRQLLARWIGRDADALNVSTPFVYAVASDSICTLNDLAEHYAAVQSMYEQAVRSDRSLDYLGRRPRQLWRLRPASESCRYLANAPLLGAFATEELAVDPAYLARHVRRALARTQIRFLAKHRVHSVTRSHNGFRVEGTCGRESWHLQSDQVVNALWQGRLAIDREVGMDVPPGWVHRLKYRVIARLPDALRNAPSLTIVLGRYGDVVVRPDGTAYLSWYPSGLGGWTHELEPPQTWEAACCGVVPEQQQREIGNSILTALDTWYAGIRHAAPLQVDAGAIIAYGDTDVDDRNSRLHERTRIGVTSIDGYHSVDPGKLTTAPMFSLVAAHRVLGHAATLVESNEHGWFDDQSPG